MSLPEIVSRDEWLASRIELLAKEKEAMRAQDALSAERRRLPMVRIEKDYKFEGPNGAASLLDMFDGRRQLLVHHFMFDPSWDAACPNCSGTADDIPHLAHLRARETNLVAVSRAPLAKISVFQSRMGWTFPWYSSFGSDFNYDFDVTLDDSVKPIFYNYRSKEEHAKAGTSYYVDGEQPFERHGLSAFLREGDAIYHTYSTYGRGVDQVGSTRGYFDLTALGRQEDWEEPRDRVPGTPYTAPPATRLHDEY